MKATKEQKRALLLAPLRNFVCDNDDENGDDDDFELQFFGGGASSVSAAKLPNELYDLVEPITETSDEVRWNFNSSVLINTRIFSLFLSYLSLKDVYKLTLLSKKLYEKVYNDRSDRSYLINMSSFRSLLTSVTSGIVGNSFLKMSMDADSCICTHDDISLLTLYFSGKIQTSDFRLGSFYALAPSTVEQSLVVTLVKSLCDGDRSRSLRYLSFEGYGLEEPNLAIFSSAICRDGVLAELTHLNISKNQANYWGMHKFLVSLVKGALPKLATLQATDNLAKAAVFEFFDIDFVKVRPGIINVDFSNNAVDVFDNDAQRCFVMKSLRFQHILQLDLSFNDLGDDGGFRLLSLCLPLRCVCDIIKQI